METVETCPICASTAHAFAFHATDNTVTHEQFSVQRCINCSFLFTSPRPTQASIGAYYLSENYISHVETARGLQDRMYHLVRKRALKGKHRLIAKYAPTGSVLDVGCGTGDFLAYMADHKYTVQGVEVSSDARNVATKKRLEVSADLETIPNGGNVNIITLWHVLEHVPYPHATLRQLNAKCASGGLLLIAVPDHESWDSQHYGADWAAWDVPRHLSHFRQQDVHNLLKQTGFQLLETKPMWFDAPYVSMLSERNKGKGNMVSMLKGWMIGLWSNSISLISDRPTSSTLYVARKV
ncbi:MAG: class I SAM-dependent methyltransferase [Flavobacteriales bacterium]